MTSATLQQSRLGLLVGSSMLQQSRLGLLVGSSTKYGGRKQVIIFVTYETPSGRSLACLWRLPRASDKFRSSCDVCHGPRSSLGLLVMPATGLDHGQV